MGSVKTNAFNFAQVMEDMLLKFDINVAEAAINTCPQVAKEAAAKLRQTSPKGPGGYAKSWTSKAEKGRMSVLATVYAEAPGYRLAHLLEHGHANRQGGRSHPDAPAIEHIKPVEEWAIKEAEDRIVEEIERKTR